MKKSNLILTLGFLFFALSVFAQPQRTDPVSYAKNQTKKMKDLINFNDKQEKKIYDLNLNYAKKRQESYADRSGDREQMRTKMREMRDDYDKELKTILDEKQYLKYLEEKEKLREGRPDQRQRQGGQGGQRGGRGGGL